MIVAILGVWKAGGAYVPLEAAQPKERLRSMLEDTRAAVVLTEERLSQFLPDARARVVCLDRDWEEVAAQSLPGSYLLCTTARDPARSVMWIPPSPC